MPNAAEVVDRVYRAEWGRIVAALIRQLGDFDLAEEVAQDAFVAALDQWATTGIPSFPRAWILQTARNRAIDRLRRQARLGRKLEEIVATRRSRRASSDRRHPATTTGTSPTIGCA